MNGLDIVIFELAGKPVLLIDLVSSVLGLTCVFLAGRNSKYNFWVGYLYTTALFLLFWNKNLYASLLLQPISLAINVLGHWRWTHPRENEQSAGDPTALKVSMLSWTERFFAIGSVFLIAGVWGWLLDSLFPNDPHPMACGRWPPGCVCTRIMNSMSDILLSIKDLHASIGEREILKGINLDIRPGEIHAVMGPNGAGKSTLSAVLAGRPDYTVTAGSASFRGRNLLALSPEERAWEGLFLSFQYPVEIPGVTITNFMKTAVNSARKARGEEPMKGAEFLKLMKEKMAFVQMKGEFAKREVNVGFSGGEKKRNEIFQMAMLDPVLSILDETDSGLDVDALRIVADGVNALHTPEKAAIIITHYQKLLEYVVPDVVHVLKEGRIVATGGRELVDLIERKGFDSF